MNFNTIIRWSAGPLVRWSAGPLVRWLGGTRAPGLGQSLPRRSLGEGGGDNITHMFTWLEQFVGDIRFGLRGLLRTPGFSLLAVLSLALGIMAVTAIYSVLYAVVLDPFPYKDVENLMSVRVSSPVQRGSRTGYSTDQFLEIAERSTIFEGVIASTISDVLWTGAGDPQRLRGNHGTFNTFEVMGVPPLLGRTPTAADAQPGAEPVVVLGYRFWQRQFGGDPNVLGRQLQLNDITRTVIGVMPKRFMWRGADVYLPVRFERGKVVEGVRGVHLLGRLKPNITAAQAEADLGPIIADLKQREPAQFPDRVARGPAAVHRNVSKLHRPRHLGVARRCRAAAAHLLRERLEPAARPRERATARNDGTSCARGEPPAAGAAAPHRKPAAGACRGRARHRARLRGTARNPGARAARHHPG